MAAFAEQHMQAQDQDQQTDRQVIEEPQKILRIGAMTRALLEELRSSELDEASRGRLGDIYDRSVGELAGLLPEDLREELKDLSFPLGDGTPSESEIRIAHAQLVGWLEGLFHGIQAALASQHAENQQRLMEMRRRGLEPGPDLPNQEPGAGTYL